MMEVSKKTSERIVEKKGEMTKNERKRKISRSSNEESGIKSSVCEKIFKKPKFTFLLVTVDGHQKRKTGTDYGHG